MRPLAYVIDVVSAAGEVTLSAWPPRWSRVRVVCWPPAEKGGVMLTLVPL
jgi:hypothetical protein